MIRSIHPHVTVNLGKQRKLEITMDSIYLAEEILDMPILGNGIEDVLGKMKAGKGQLRFVRALLYAGLRTFDPEITLPQVGKLINLESLPEITDAIQKALRLFFQNQGIPIELNPKTERPLAMEETTGSGSGASQDLLADSA